jgi:hypothetical protein
VTHRQMLAALLQATSDPHHGVAYYDVQAIRAASFAAASASPSALSPNRRSSNLSA